MIEAYHIEAIAVGNGTASRETEEFLKHQTFRQEIQVFVVSEQGASIYSASRLRVMNFRNTTSQCAELYPSPAD